jgi:hypothetical protein
MSFIITQQIGQLHASHAFICVEVHVDGKGVGGNATFMRVALDAWCKEVLFEFWATHASYYSPLPESTNVVMMCAKNFDMIHSISASDVGTIQDCTVLLDFPVSMAMSKVPTKRFTFECIRPIEARPPRQNLVVVMMTQMNFGCLHLPPVRTSRIVITGKDVLYNDFRKYLKDRGADMYKVHNIVPFGTMGNGLCGLRGKRKRGFVGLLGLRSSSALGLFRMLVGIVRKGVVTGKTRRNLSIWAINVSICSIVGIELQYI